MSLRSNGQCAWSSKTCVAAIAGNNIEIAQWLKDNGCPWDEEACRTTQHECDANIALLNRIGV